MSTSNTATPNPPPKSRSPTPLDYIDETQENPFEPNPSREPEGNPEYSGEPPDPSGEPDPGDPDDNDNDDEPPPNPPNPPNPPPDVNKGDRFIEAIRQLSNSLKDL